VYGIGALIVLAAFNMIRQSRRLPQSGSRVSSRDIVGRARIR
jgi:hypothetical protein